MKNDTDIARFFYNTAGYDGCLLIDKYQRHYEWSKPELATFISTITKIETALKNGDLYAKFNLGNIIIFNPDNKYKKVQIVDGQQRLITFSLLLCALRDEGNTTRKDQLGYLDACLCKTDPNNKGPKIYINNYDRKPYEDILFTSQTTETHHPIAKAYSFFKKYVKESNLTIDELYEYLQRLTINVLECENQEEAYRAFVNVNAYGKKVKSGDSIPSMLLPLIDKFNSDEVKDEYREKVDLIIADMNINSPKNYDSNSFYMRYLYNKTDTIFKACTISRNFEEYLKGKNIKDVIDDLEKFVDFEKKISCITIEDKLVRNALSLLPKHTSIKMLLSDLMSPTSNKLGDITLTSKEIVTILNSFGAHIVRRNIHGFSNSDFDMCYRLVTKTVKLFKQPDNALTFTECFRKVMYSTFVGTLVQASKRYITDEEFKHDILSFNLYNSKRLCLPILMRINSYKHEDEEILYQSPTIEHIMPQHGNATNHELHTIGNLTIIGDKWNKQMSDKSFNEKKETYKESSLRINRYFDNVNEWNNDEILKRTNYLADLLVEIYRI